MTDRCESAYRRTLFLVCIAIVQISLSTGRVAAQDGPASSGSPPDTIIVTAPAPEDGPGPAPGVFVIDIEDVRRGGDATVADVIETVPGLQVQRTGSGFESSSVRIRGSTAEQVIVLRDGQPIADGRSSVTDISRLSLAGVRRVEIVLGPATALYGAGGAAGAVNLITTPDGASGPGVTGVGRLIWGSFGEYRFAGSTTLTGETERARYVTDLSLDGALAENTYRFERLGEVEERRNAGGGQGAVDLSIDRESDRLRLGIDGSVSAFRRGLPGTVEFPSATAELSEERAGVRFTVATAAMGATDGAGSDGEAFVPGGTARSSVAAQLNASRSNREFRDDEYPLGALVSDSALTAVAGEVVVTVPMRPVRVQLPLSSRLERLEDSELGGQTRGTVAVAPGVESFINIPGGSAIGVDLTGRLSAIVAGTVAGGDLLPSARGSVGWTAARLPFWSGVAVAAGYRLPDFSELFLEGSAFAIGNPDLEPEESRSAEWELRLGDRYVQPAGGSTTVPVASKGFRLALFVTEYRELIQWLPDPTGYWRPRNTGEALMYGAETDAAVTVPVGLSPWSAEGSGGIDILQARDRNDGVTFDQQLPYRPQLSFRGALGIEHLLGHRVDFSVLGRGARPITRQNTVWLDPYIDISVGATIPVIAERASVSVEARNLLDEGYVETRFYPNPGREFRIALEVVW